MSADPKIEVGKPVVKTPAVVLGFDDTGQLQVVVMDGDLLRACALLHIAATRLDMMEGVANQKSLLKVVGMPGTNGRRE